MVIRRSIANAIAANLKHPKKGIKGWLAQSLMKRSQFLEESAVKLCGIQAHHRVVEVGFGLGHGLKAAYPYIRDGTGCIHGVEISKHMFNTAFKKFKTEIHDGKIDINLASVTKMPFNSNSIDRIFHCNTFYYWPRLEYALMEMYRVMKPGSLMVTTLDVDSIKTMKAKGYLQYASTDLIVYMCALEFVGFKNVRIEYLTEPRCHQVIYAHVADEKLAPT